MVRRKLLTPGILNNVATSLREFYRSYERVNRSSPLLVQGVAGAGTWALGSCIVQYHAKPKEKLDYKEAAIYGSYGAIVSNVGHKWYKKLDKVFSRRALTPWQVIAAKLIADAVIFNPIHVGAFLCWTNIPIVGSMEELHEAIRRSYVRMVVVEAAMWTPVQILNFSWLPPRHQQMFVNVVSLAEATVMSWLNHPTVHVESASDTVLAYEQSSEMVQAEAC